jgi:sugar transferase (PEP-CTERM/EpsH1 system associated)
LLFLSHCVPNPPNKGEKIRAYHEICYLANEYRIHLACFARTHAEIADAAALQDCCASVYVDLLPYHRSLLRALAGFAAGACLNTSFYHSSNLATYARSLADLPLSATLAYTCVMARYAPRGIPLLLDMVDVDSEKWLQYGSERWPSAAWSLEGRRLREVEKECARLAESTFVTTAHEQALLQGITGREAVAVENGVDFAYFDPFVAPELPELNDRRFLVFIGAMDYYPNIEAACRFAAEIFPHLRREDPTLEFFVVGHNPSKAVKALERRDGITVTGSVVDVRPYLVAAQAVVAPLRVARGIQNKVLEALAMNKPVLAEPTVCRTFGVDLPSGVIRCESLDDWRNTLSQPAADLRRAAQARFDWGGNMERLASQLREAIARQAVGAAALT